MQCLVGCLARWTGLQAEQPGVYALHFPSDPGGTSLVSKGLPGAQCVVSCCFNYLLPELGLGNAALSACIVRPFYFYTFSGWGSPVCVHCHTLLLLHLLWVGQPHICTVWLHRAFACRHRNDVLVPPFICTGQPYVHVLPHFTSFTPTPSGEIVPSLTPHEAILHVGIACFAISTLSLDWAFLHVGSTAFASSSLSPGSCMCSTMGPHSRTLPYPLDQSLGGGGHCMHSMVLSCSCWI